MQITFGGSPTLLRVEDVASSLIDADESLRQQITNLILSAICDNNIPLRNKAGSKVPLHVLGDVASSARQIAADKTREELGKFDARIKLRAAQDFDDEVKRRAARNAGLQAIAQLPEKPILTPEAIIQSPLWRDMREEQAKLLAEREPPEARDWMNDRFRKGFVQLSEVADWLRKEQGFDVTIVESSIPKDDALARTLAKWFDKPINDLPPKLRRLADLYVPRWPELSGADRRARADEADTQWFGVLCNRIEQANREREHAENDPKQVAEGVVAWYDVTIDAMTWWGLGSVTPREAAMLLCRFNPHDDKLDPLSITTDETSPEDFKRLLRVFEDVARSRSQPRTLSDWHDIACSKRLKYHSWIDAFQQAVTEMAPTTNTPTQVPDEALEQTALSGATDNPAPEVLTPNTTGLVAWQAETLENWSQIVKMHGTKPAARQVMRWLKDNGARDTFPEGQKDRESLQWIDTYGQAQTLTIGRLSTVLSEWRKAGKIAA